MTQPYEGVGGFQYEWQNPPPPFNPQFDPGAKARYERVSQSMQADGYYDGHTRAECAADWRRRYDADKAAGSTTRK